VPRLCEVCISPNRPSFEAAVASGATVKAAAGTAGLAYDGAKRHIRNHPRSVTTQARVVTRMNGGRPAAIVETFERAFEHAAMTWQRQMLEETRDTFLLKGRQVGATEVASALAIHTARSKAGSTTAIISPSQRQSSEVTARARHGFWLLGETLRQDSVSLLRLANGSRVISLPGNARGIRGYSCDLVILDEAAWIPAETFTAARPLTAATGGRLIVQSTPGAPVGPFYELAENVPDDWASFKVRCDEVPTISAEFLDRERRQMAPDLYAQEYEAEFSRGIGSGALFSIDQLAGLILPEGRA
jgi:hypothetical protein